MKDILCGFRNFDSIFFRETYALFELKKLAKIRYTTELEQLVQHNSSENSWNFIVKKDIYCVDVHVGGKFWFNFLELCPLWTKKFVKNEMYYQNSLSAQLLWNCSTEFHGTLELMKDIMHRCAYLEKFLIQIFFLGVMPLF